MKLGDCKGKMTPRDISETLFILRGEGTKELRFSCSRITKSFLWFFQREQLGSALSQLPWGLLVECLQSVPVLRTASRTCPLK